MKLIITIPKEKYSYIQELEQGNTDYATTRMLYHAVKHGKPYLEQEPNTGRWIPVGYDGYADGNPVYDWWECSECGWEHTGDEESLTAFCPNCGTKMEEIEE